MSTEGWCKCACSDITQWETLWITRYR